MRRWWMSITLVSALVMSGFSALLLANQSDAASASQWKSGYIISDAQFYDIASMSVDSIQAFLNSKGSSCIPGTAPCIKDYRQDTPTVPADAYCKTYQGQTGQSAASIIWNVGQACGINPKVLIVTLQKENTLITRTQPTTASYQTAMGYGCPDNAACDTAYFGFFNQVYKAARQFKIYAANPASFSFVAGAYNNIQYNPVASCGSSSVYIQNQATASLYNYTPYQPNTAALANLNGIGNGCSTYGNRNFWVFYTDWFGDPTAGLSPIGVVDQVIAIGGAIQVSGWAVDPDSMGTQLMINVYIGGPAGVGVGYNIGATNQARSDIAKAFTAAGLGHGFDATIKTSLTGQQSVYIYALNAPGTDGGNTLLGTRTVTIGVANPIGNVDQTISFAGAVQVSGWALDPDAPGAALIINVYIGGPAGTGEPHNIGPASQRRPDIAASYAAAGTDHGFNSTIVTSKTGTQVVYIYALNAPGTGGGNTLLGTRTVTIGSASPIGNVDQTTSTSGAVQVRGWALDPDTPAAALIINVYIGGPAGTGEPHNIGNANQSRPDIAAIYSGAVADHGFNATVKTSKTGTQVVYIYALNAPGTGGVNTLLGTRTVNISAPLVTSPMGSLEFVTGGAGTVRVGGWAIDLDSPSTALDIHVYIGGPVGIGQGYDIGPADQGRADVAAVYAAAGANHGFNSTIATTMTGSQPVYVYAINAPGSGGGNTLLGSTTVVVTKSTSFNPAGAVDQATGQVGGVLVRGWAFDQSNPAAPVEIRVCIGGTIGTVQCSSIGNADQDRPDVATVFPAAGAAHGFNATVATTTTGNQTVNIYAVGSDGTSGLLGTAAVTIT